jgi:hypothetical protein
MSALLAVCSLWLFLILRDRASSGKLWLLYGTFWGIASLINPALLAIGIVPTVYLLSSRPRLLVPASLGLAALICLTGPWVGRNYITFHRLIPIKATFGPNFWWGLKPGFEAWPDRSVYDGEASRYLQMGETAFDDACMSEARAFIQRSPKAFWLRTAQRAVSFWTNQRIAGRGIATLLSALGILGFLLLLGRDRQLGIVFAGAVLLYPIAYYLTLPLSLYRYPIEPILCILAASLLFARTNNNPASAPDV